MNLLRKIAGSIFVVLVLAGSIKEVSAQQDPMYTQYMDNLLVINPGFAGSKEIGNFLLVSRNQWVSFEGAPRSASLSYNTPIKKEKIGLGFSILSDKIGPQKQNGVYVDYSYFLRLTDHYQLGMGLKAGIGFFQAALTELDPLVPDPIFSTDLYNSYLPNFGFGGYLFSDDTYFGLSVPNLIRNTISRNNYQTEYVQIEEIHVYLIGGKKFELAPGFHLKASAMFRYVRTAPVAFDVTALIGFKEKFWVGGMFRLGDSYGILAQFQASEEIKIGYSYDLTYSQLNAFNNGTHEIMISYDINIFQNYPR
jgi:type IX secretion system PorP/SprF family membrane protein